MLSLEKLVKPGTNLISVPFEDLFDYIHDSHIKKGHPGRDIMQQYLATNCMCSGRSFSGDFFH